MTVPNRIIKESVCVSDSIDTLTWFEEVFFYRLIVNCDDYGRFDARPPILRARLFPLKSITNKQIADALLSLRSASMIDIYDVDGHSFLQIRKWDIHQRVRAKVSRFPAPNGELQPSADTCCQMTADDSEMLTRDSNVLTSVCYNPNPNPNPNTNRESAPAHTRVRFDPPTAEEVEAYCLDNGLRMDTNRFIDFYASKGWLVGKSPMRDWRAAARNWAARDAAESAPAKSEMSSFDIEDAFNAALAKTYGGDA